eukprot:jgi/Bigna1/129959/aug1.10_g4667
MSTDTNSTSTSKTVRLAIHANNIAFNYEHCLRTVQRYMTETILYFFKALLETVAKKHSEEYSRLQSMFMSFPSVRERFEIKVSKIKDYSRDSANKIGQDLLLHLEREWPEFDIRKAVYKFVLVELATNKQMSVEDTENGTANSSACNVDEVQEQQDKADGSSTQQVVEEKQQITVDIEDEHVLNFLHACVSNAAKDFENDIDLLIEKPDYKGMKSRKIICKEAVKNAVIDFYTKHGKRSKTVRHRRIKITASKSSNTEESASRDAHDDSAVPKSDETELNDINKSTGHETEMQPITKAHHQPYEDSEFEARDKNDNEAEQVPQVAASTHADANEVLNNLHSGTSNPFETNQVKDEATSSLEQRLLDNSLITPHTTQEPLSYEKPVPSNDYLHNAETASQKDEKSGNPYTTNENSCANTVAGQQHETESHSFPNPNTPFEQSQSQTPIEARQNSNEVNDDEAITNFLRQHGI